MSRYKNLKNNNMYFSYGSCDSANRFVSGIKEHTIVLMKYCDDYRRLQTICTFKFQSSKDSFTPYGMKIEFCYSDYTIKEFTKYISGFERFRNGEIHANIYTNYNRNEFGHLLNYMKIKKAKRIEFDNSKDCFKLKKKEV